MVINNDELQHAIRSPMPGPGRIGSRQLRSLMALKLEQLLRAPVCFSDRPGVTNKKKRTYIISAGSKINGYQDDLIYVPSVFLRPKAPAVIVGFQLEFQLDPIKNTLVNVTNIHLVGQLSPREVRAFPGGATRRVPVSKFKPLEKTYVTV